MNLDHIHIVMVETTHSGNVGAAARAMKNMGLSQLVLVNPQCHIDEQAYARASGADSILNQCRVFATLPEALQDTHLIVGTSARPRTLSWPQLEPGTLPDRVAELEEGERASILFGREHSGLTNDEMQLCHYALTIPTVEGFSSLNVASAIQIICYELYAQLGQSADAASIPKQSNKEPVANAGELDGLFDHLEKTITLTGFLNPQNPGQMMKRLRRLLLRAHPSRNEVNILRGILTSVEKLSK